MSNVMTSAQISALRGIFPDHELVARAILKRFTGTPTSGSVGIDDRSFLLCMTPRSGSSLLCDVITQTESFGNVYEHIRPDENPPIPDWMAAYANLREALRVLADLSPAGHFGMKGDLYQMFPLITEGLFAGPGGIRKHLYLTRRDHIGQAVSLARAKKTNEWHSHDAPAPDPDLAITDVVSQLHYLRTMEAEWEIVFAALRLAPLRLYYEDLISDRSGVLEKVRQYLDVQWKIDPAGIVSDRQSLSERHDPRWIQNIRAQFEAQPAA
jgi:LPS sulfotransferase NodH